MVAQAQNASSPLVLNSCFHQLGARRFVPAAMARLLRVIRLSASPRIRLSASLARLSFARFSFARVRRREGSREDRLDVYL
jgi:hypothetical protein